MITNYPTRFPTCLWARAILPYPLTGADYPHATVDLHQGIPLHQIAAKRHIAIYPDGAGFRHQAHQINQRVGCGAFITALDEEGGWDPTLQAFCFKSVTGHQTVPRAELTMPLHLLPQLTNALSVLVVTDNEPFYLNATDTSRLTKALRGENADLWQQWAVAAASYPAGVVIAHIRSHALDDDSDKAKKLLSQNIHRRRYRTPAQRNAEQQPIDDWACQHHRGQHDGLLHSVGNAYGDRAATVAQTLALPSEHIAAEYEKHAAYAACIAKRIAIVEAHCRRTDIHMQNKLTEVPPAPDFQTTLLDTTNALGNMGHEVYTQGEWLRCRRCPIKTRLHGRCTFLTKPCTAMPALHLKGLKATTNADAPTCHLIGSATTHLDTEPPPRPNTRPTVPHQLAFSGFNLPTPRTHYTPQ